MGMSISKAQAELLATDFLDNLGSGKNGFKPKQTFTDLILMAGEFIEDCQDNLNQSANNATGRLSESLQAGEPRVDGGIFEIDIYMAFYGAFQNKGVRGTRSGKSNAGYSFKNEFPSESMVKAIAEWIKNAQISTRTVKQYEGYGKNEIKNKSISQYDDAYAKARSIKIHGIKPTGFLDKAIVTTSQKVKDRLGLALKVDIINSIMPENK